jgi:folylpolyglutamate synthase/dihydropteroate synthase
VTERYQKEMEVIDDPGEALRYSLSFAGKEDLICATGSLYLVGKIKEASAGQEGQRPDCRF